MKKITLLLMACCMSLMTFAAGGDITYVLNGGVFNDNGWKSKSEMFDAFMYEANPAWEWETLEYYLEQPDPLGSPNICSGLLSCVILNNNADTWGWLKTYIIDVTAEQLAVTPAPVPLPTALAASDDLASAAWRYAVGAFFVNWQRAGWPVSANFAEAGKPEAFIPAWEHAFAGPATYDGTEEIILPIPYHAEEPFAGWFDNPECKGFRITSIPAGASGDLTLYAKYGEYNPPSGEITYVLNGGVFNDDGWQSKIDMLEAFSADYITRFGSSAARVWGANTKPGDIVLSTYPDMVQIFDHETIGPRWAWLKEYVIKVATESSYAYLSELVGGNNTYWRASIDGFFTNSQYLPGAWNGGPDFTSAGLPEAFMPTWKHGFAGPESYDGTIEIILPVPYKEGETFLGWYADAAFSGSKITSIPVGSEGERTFYAKFGEYVLTCKEVWDLAAGTSARTSGVVTYFNGTTAYIQDATAGLMVEFAAAPDIATGNLITVTGATATVGTDYVKLSGAALADKEPATLPATPKIALTTLAANMFKYVTVEGLIVTAVSGNNVSLSDGANSVTLVVSGFTFPVNTKVNVMATVGYTDAIILAGYAAGVTKAPLANPDPAVYVPMGDEGQYTLKSKWLISSTMDNLSANQLGVTSMVRGMVVKDGKMYFSSRDTNDPSYIQLVVVDGATGEKLDPIVYTTTDAFRQDGSYIFAPFNDLKLDSKGNILTANLPVSNTTPFQIWKLDTENPANSTIILDEKMADHPDFADISAIRFDHIGVYGDVDKDAYILAINSFAWEVYKWTITDGVASDEPEVIYIDTETPGTSLTGVVVGGSSAAMTFPVDENYFYVDNFYCIPTLVDMDGLVVDGFYNHDDTSIRPGSSPNGLAEFEVGGEHFLILGYTNTDGSPRSTFRMYKFKDGNKEFSDLEPMWVFPSMGMGAVSNDTRVAMPFITVDEVTATATIYVYYANNGYGVYEFRTDGGTGIKSVVKSEAIKVFASGNEIRLSENAANLKVYNLVGQVVQSAQGVSSVSVANSGIYIVAVQTLNGEIVTKKVIIK